MNNALSKILFFLNSKDKKNLINIFLCVMIVGIIETAGVAVILPFMAVVAKTEIVYTNPYLFSVYSLLGFSEPKYFILLLGSMVFLFLVLGNAFSGMTSWLMLKFCYHQGKQISCALLERYLKQPYVFFVNRNSNELAKNILAEVDRLTVGIFITLLQSISKIVMMLCIFGLLLLINPWLACTIIMILGSAYVIIYRIIRKKLLAAGKVASEMTTARYRLCREAMGAIKELKIVGREQVFCEAYTDAASKYAKAETLSQLSPMVTRYFIEAIALGGMVLIALFLICTQEDISQFLPLLGLYALAGYRLMPAMQQLFSGFSALKYHYSALDVLFQEMQLLKEPCIELKQDKLRFTFSLLLKDIHYAYPNAKNQALAGINLEIPLHATVGIVGASGAGKTTLIDIILGLLQPNQGVLTLDNVIINETNIPTFQKNIGYVPQNIFLLDSTVASNIALGVNPQEINHEAVEHAARLANLHEFISHELSQGYLTPIGEAGVRLSGGQRQRIGIARALYHNPELLIFDEATSALDGMTEMVIMEAIKSLARRKTIILIAHRLNTVKECDVIYVLNKGIVIGKGTYAELLQSNKMFQGLATSHLLV